jgi:hypothetical protein
VDASAEESNRGKLNTYFEEQGNGRSLNVVEELGLNFDAAAVPGEMNGITIESTQDSGRFNARWFAGNSLDNPEAAQQAPALSRLNVDRQGQGQAQEGEAPPPAAAKPQRAPQVVQQQAEETVTEGQPGRAGGGGFGRFGGRKGDTGGGEEDVVQKYQQRLVEQADLAQQQAMPGGMPAADDDSDGVELQTGVMPGGPQAGGAMPADAAPGEGAPGGAGAGGGVPGGGPMPGERDPPASLPALASLDVELPQRGREYLFTTPRGDVEITARSVGAPFLGRFLRAGLVLAAALAAWGLYRFLRRRRMPRVEQRRLGALLLVAGLASLIGGIFPIAGLIAAAGGVVLLVRPRGAAAA